MTERKSEIHFGCSFNEIPLKGFIMMKGFDDRMHYFCVGGVSLTQINDEDDRFATSLVYKICSTSPFNMRSDHNAF